MPMIPGAMGAPMLPPGAPPAPMMGGPAFPSLDPSVLGGALAPLAAMQQADQAALQAQQQQAVNQVLAAMRAAPNPAAQAAMVEPGAPTSPLDMAEDTGEVAGGGMGGGMAA